MSSFKASLKNEILLMLYRRKTVGFLGFAALLPILLAVPLMHMKTVIGLSIVNSAFPIQMLSISTAAIVPLFLLLGAADLFPGETSARTLKLALLRPVTRFKVFLAKTAALCCGAAGILLVSGVVTSLLGLLYGTAGAPGDTLKAYFAALIPMIALGTAFVLIAQVFKSASGSLVFSLLLYIVFKAAPLVFPSFSAFSFASYTDWHILWLNPAVSAGKLLNVFLVLASSAALFFSVGYLMFDKREV